MSKLFTVLTACLIALGAGVAGYAYYTGSSLHTEWMTSKSDSGSNCSLCELAKKRPSCCDGESLAKIQALSGEEEGSCCSLGSDKVAAASVVGGPVFACSTTAKTFSCCEDAPAAPSNAVAGLAGTAVNITK